MTDFVLNRNLHFSIREFRRIYSNTIIGVTNITNIISVTTEEVRI